MYREILNTIDTTKQITLSEDYINQHMGNHGKIAIHKGHIVFDSHHISAEFAYSSHYHTDHDFYILAHLLKIQPFYYRFTLPFVNKQFPFLEYRGDNIISCCITQIPGTKSIVSLQHLKKINTVQCHSKELIIHLV